MNRAVIIGAYMFARNGNVQSGRHASLLRHLGMLEVRDVNQLNLDLIPHTVEGEVINQRARDGYINATAMCKAVGKKFNDYSRLKATEEFLRELSVDAGIPATELIQTLIGGHPNNQGTWVHPDVAVNLAQWLSTKFAVQVSRWVREWMSGELKPSPVGRLPVHLERYLLNRPRVPHTHFSILNELAINLIAPLEEAGYTIPEQMVPDISEGRIFSQWLRNNRGVEPKSFPNYNHEYIDGRIVQARLYPIEYLADFRRHFNEIWLPNHAPRYFGERDRTALRHVTLILLPDKVA